MSNTAGTLAAIIGTVGAGYFVELVGSFPGFLLLTSLLYFLAALFYCLFSTGERVNFDDPGEYKGTVTFIFQLANLFRIFSQHSSLALWILASLVYAQQLLKNL